MAAMDNVYHGIWLGNVNAARDADGLRRAGVTHIINCAALQCPSFFPHDFAYTSLALTDTPSQNILQHFAETSACMRDARRDGGVVFLHCIEGKSRSAACVIAFLIDTEGMAMREALALLQSARPVVRPNEGFLLQLQHYEKIARGRNATGGMSLQTLGQPGEVCPPLGTLPAQTGGGHHAGQHGDGLPNDWPQFAVLAPHGQPANRPVLTAPWAGSQGPVLASAHEYAGFDPHRSLQQHHLAVHDVYTYTPIPTQDAAEFSVRVAPGPHSGYQHEHLRNAEYVDGRGHAPLRPHAHPRNQEADTRSRTSQQGKQSRPALLATARQSSAPASDEREVAAGDALDAPSPPAAPAPPPPRQSFGGLHHEDIRGKHPRRAQPSEDLHAEADRLAQQEHGAHESRQSRGTERALAQRRAYSGSAPEPGAPKHNVPLSYDARAPHAHSPAQVRDPYRRPLPRPRDHMPRYVLRQGDGNSSFNPHTQERSPRGKLDEISQRRVAESRRSPPEPKNPMSTAPESERLLQVQEKAGKGGKPHARLHGDEASAQDDNALYAAMQKDSVFQQLMATKEEDAGDDVGQVKRFVSGRYIVGKELTC